jgi:PIN domain nuclease of toxin-antitoxin system
LAALVVDTHAAVWYLLNSSRLSSVAQRAMDDAADAGDPVYLSAISLVEIVYLVEKGRLPTEVIERLSTALSDPHAGFTVAPMMNEQRGLCSGFLAVRCPICLIESLQQPP